MSVDMRVLQSLAAPLLQQSGPIYVSVGCERVYMAHVPPTKCKKCDDVHDVFEVHSMEDLDVINS